MKPSLQRRLLFALVILLVLGALSSPAASVSLSQLYVERERTQAQAGLERANPAFASPPALTPLLLVGLPLPPP